MYNFSKHKNMGLVFTKFPQRGDAVVAEKATGKLRFITGSSYVDSLLDTSVYEKQGGVADCRGREVLFAALTSANKAWAVRYVWKLTGYTLDGTDRTGILSVREASDSWAANHDYTISYNAESKQALADALNAHFAAESPFTPALQDWYAYLDGEDILLSCSYTDYRQASYDTGKTGFTLTANLLPDVAAHASVRRKHGLNGGEGAIHNIYRALTYFRQDLASGTYNPATDVTDYRTTYPVCLPAYLGTSANQRPGGIQADHCAVLRARYGEGETGWKRYMESCIAQCPSDWGNMGMRNGAERTALLASKKMWSPKANGYIDLCPAAVYAYSHGTAALPAGKWHLPTLDEICRIMRDAKYPSESSDRNVDSLNAILYKMGGSAIGNSTGLWSCLRYSTGSAWNANGNVGFLGSVSMCYSNGALPVGLYILPEAD